jgi:predicted DNA-binding antitoxin AbrB/MazE fold protein
MYISTEAVYNNGVLRPTAPLTQLANGQHVIVILYDEEELRKREKEFIEQMKAEGRIVQFPEAAPPPPVENFNRSRFRASRCHRRSWRIAGRCQPISSIVAPLSNVTLLKPARAS